MRDLGATSCPTSCQQQKCTVSGFGYDHIHATYRSFSLVEEHMLYNSGIVQCCRLDSCNDHFFLCISLLLSPRARLPSCFPR